MRREGNSMKRLRIGYVFCIVVFLVISMVMACSRIYSCGGYKGHRIGERFLTRIQKKLDLSEKQTKLVMQFKEEIRSKKKALYQKQKAMYSSFLAEWSKENPSRKVIQEYYSQKHQIHKKIQALAVEKLLILHATLDNAQKKKLAKIMAKIKKRYDKHDQIKDES